MHIGEWYQCQSCGEESLWVWRDPCDFICSNCGGGAPVAKDNLLDEDG